MRTIVSLAVAAAVLLAGCGVLPSPAPSTSPASTPTPAASSIPASPSTQAAIVLREAPADLGCDSIGWPDDIAPYSSLTFRIDPSAEEQVRAVSDTGRELVTYWAAGFEPGSATERLIRDPDGQVVARDGEVVNTPAGGWNLHGHSVCMQPDTLSVLLTQPG